MHPPFFVDAAINLLGFLVCALLCLVRPALVLEWLKPFSWPGGRYEQIPEAGEAFARRLRSIRHFGLYWLGFTLFLGVIVFAVWYRSVPRKSAERPSVLSIDPNFHRH